MRGLDTSEAPDRRAPSIAYPALPGATEPRPLDKLIGTTHAQVLTELSAPLATGELAERLHLSPSTGSYHLQVLHRAGLVRRTRQVFYHNVRADWEARSQARP